MDLFKEVMPSLNEKTEHLLDINPLEEKSYRSMTFIVNKAFSQALDTILFANTMNKLWNLQPKLQYDFYFYGLPKKKRYNKWAKEEGINNIELIMEYYDYGEQKAKEILKILTSSQIENIRQRLYKGEEIKK